MSVETITSLALQQVTGGLKKSAVPKALEIKSLFANFERKAPPKLVIGETKSFVEEFASSLRFNVKKT